MHTFTRGKRLRLSNPPVDPREREHGLAEAFVTLPESTCEELARFRQEYELTQNKPDTFPDAVELCTGED